MGPADIAATRRLLGLSADQLGELLGINPRTIRGWEAGKYSPSDSAADALLQLRARHDGEFAVLLQAAARGTVTIPEGSWPRGWYLALAARIIDRRPDVRIAWDAE